MVPCIQNSCRDEIDDLCEAHPDRFSVYYTLSQPPSDWVHGQGRVSAEMVAEHLPGPSPSTQVRSNDIVYVCVCVYG